MIIAIDGTSASGKGTIGKWLAHKLNFAYLDTGLMYRFVAFKALEKNCYQNEDDVINLTKALDFHNLDAIETNLKSNEIASITSKYIAKIQSVRNILIEFQQNFGSNPSSFINQSVLGAVVDGRDMGTKVFPNANLKFFITASAPQRAKRRYKELKDNTPLVSYEDILESLILRDNQDRNNGNFDKSPQAIEIDTTNLTKEESCELVYQYTIEKLGL